MQITKEQLEKNNKRVLEKWKNGDNLANSTPEDTWYPEKGVFDKAKGKMVSTYKPESEQVVEEKPKEVFVRKLTLVKND
jgi:hypothetical protein